MCIKHWQKNSPYSRINYDGGVKTNSRMPQQAKEPDQETGCRAALNPWIQCKKT